MRATASLEYALLVGIRTLNDVNLAGGWRTGASDRAVVRDAVRAIRGIDGPHLRW